MKGKIVDEYGRTRPKWADEQFGKWLIEHCSIDDTRPVIIMELQLIINGAYWIREQFELQGILKEPNEETAREMFSALVAIHFSSQQQIPQRDIFQQIFNSYLRTSAKDTNVNCRCHSANN